MIHRTAFEYLKPTDQQIKVMAAAREAALNYSIALENLLPEGPDKTYVLRTIRTAAMWANIAITRTAEGSPRTHI
jgi:hypothetical protein